MGNLVCPGDFDLGEDLRVLLLSATEGEGKPLKYPTLINTADAVIVNKLDLAAAVECDVDLLETNIRLARPGAAVSSSFRPRRARFRAVVDLPAQPLAGQTGGRLTPCIGSRSP